jgi:hypothetical protein
MVEYQENDREKAVRDVLNALRNQLALLSVPDRECAYALSSFHKITADDLLDCAVQRARST